MVGSLFCWVEKKHLCTNDRSGHTPSWRCSQKNQFCETTQTLKKIHERLARIDERLVQVEHFERVAMTRMNEVRIMQKRNFDKMMDGFKAIQKAFHMMANAVVDINEDLSENLGVVLKI